MTSNQPHVGTKHAAAHAAGHWNRLFRPVVISVTAVLLLFSMAAWSQTVTSTILGTVGDAQKAVIPGANVTVTNEGTGEQRTAATDAVGGFSFPGLQPGNYTLRVMNAGFQTYERTGIVLTASERLPVGNIVMSVGSVTEVVTVTADAAVVSTVSAEGSAALNSRQIETIAQRGRNVTSYLRLLPGVDNSTLEVEALNSMEIGTPLPSVGGISGRAMSIGMDGQNGQDNGTSSSYTTSQSPESVAEIKVLLNNYQAEYGRNGGAIINLITKSGTREYHGSAYWYKRHEMFNAQNFFNNKGGIPKQRYRFINMGFTIGGPILPGHNKLFFFNSFETNPSGEPRPIVRRTMPTALEIGGNFSQSFEQNGKLYVIKDPLTGQPFTGNVIPPNRLNSSGQALLRNLPDPNRLEVPVSAGYNYEYSDIYTFTRWQELFKIDYRISDKDSIFFRGTWWDSSRAGNVLSSGSFEWAKVANIYWNKHAVLNWTRILSPTVLNDFNVGFRRPQERVFLNNDDPAADILLRSRIGFTAGQWHPEVNPEGIVPRSSFGGVANSPDTGGMYWYRVPQYEDDINWTISDGFTVIRGVHTFKFGMYFEKARITTGVGASKPWPGYFNFNRDVNNPLDTGHPFSNAALGVFQQYQEVTARTKPAGVAIDLDWYAQDSWRVTKRLTLEIGLRSAYFTPFFQWDGQNSAFAPERYDPALAPTFYQPTKVNGVRRALNPLTGETTFQNLIGGYVPNSGDPGNGYVTTNTPGYPVGFYEKPGKFSQLQPRFGFALDVFGDGKTAIRGGFGMFHQILRWEPVSAGPPIGYLPVLYYSTLDTFLNAAGTLFPSSATSYDRYMQVPTYMNLTLGIQRDIGFGTLLDVKYVGTLGRNLQVSQNTNTLPYGARFEATAQDPTTGKPLSDDFLRPYPGIGNLTYNQASGSSNYHALQATANRRIARGMQFGMSYAYSKMMDYGNLPLWQPHRWNYGKSTTDQTHSLVINYTWDLPGLSQTWDSPFVKYVFDNWQISGITTFSSGNPLGIGVATTDNADLLGGGETQRVVITGDPRLPHGERTVDHMFKTGVFARPAVGDPGNAAKDVFRGPGQNNFDITLFKNIPVRNEKRNLQLRWEIYNLLNHTQFTTVDTTARFDTAGNQVNGLFGRATGARNARIMQAAIKFLF